MPLGVRGEDAFGHRPAFENRGAVERALLNIGREDVVIEGLAPLDPRFRVLGGSSDYLVLDVGGTADALRVGDVVTFSLNYSALLAVMTSQYVEKRTLYGMSTEHCRGR